MLIVFTKSSLLGNFCEIGIDTFVLSIGLTEIPIRQFNFVLNNNPDVLTGPYVDGRKQMVGLLVLLEPFWEDQPHQQGLFFQEQEPSLTKL